MEKYVSVGYAVLLKLLGQNLIASDEMPQKDFCERQLYLVCSLRYSGGGRSVAVTWCQAQGDVVGKQSPVCMSSTPGSREKLPFSAL